MIELKLSMRVSFIENSVDYIRQSSYVLPFFELFSTHYIPFIESTGIAMNPENTVRIHATQNTVSITQ